MRKRLLVIRVVLIILAGVATVGGQSQVSDEEPFQTGHTDDVTRVSLSPDAQKIASYSGGDETLRIWDLRSQRVLQRVLWSSQIVTAAEAYKYRDRRITSLAWSSDSAMLAVGTSYGTVISVQATSGRKLWENEDCKPYVNVLIFSSTSDSVACGTAGKPPDGSVTLLDAQSGKLIRSFRASLGSQFWLKIDGKNPFLLVNTADWCTVGSLLPADFWENENCPGVARLFRIRPAWLSVLTVDILRFGVVQLLRFLTWAPALRWLRLR